MERKDYLRYIAHFISHVDPLVSRVEYRDYLKRHVGPSLTAAPESKVRDTARHLYAAYVTSLYSRYGAWDLARKLTTKDIAALLEEEVAIGKKYGVYTETVDRDLSSKGMDRHMKAISERTGYEKALTEIMEDAPAAKPRKAPVKRAPVKKATGKSPAKRKTPVKKTGKSPKRSASAKPTGKSPAKKSAAKRCGDYSVKELRDMAAVKAIKGRSTMKKDELCAALRIPK